MLLPMRKALSYMESQRRRKRRLGALSPLDAYKVGLFTPQFVLDPVSDKYFANSSLTTFTDAVGFTRASNATMVDSDGVLKWAPHNLLTYSEDLTQWTALSTTTTATSFTGDGGAAKYIAQNATVSAVENTISFTTSTADGQWIQVINTGSGAYFANIDVLNGALGTAGSGATATVVPLGDEYLVTVTFDGVGSYSPTWRIYLQDSGAAGYGGSSTSTATINVSKAHLYRSDLGGMVNNPATGDSYVPTTSAARYLPRVGHHEYIDGEWVRGILAEPTAATNLLLNSGTLATQNVTVTAVAHTIHFTGTGTITLTGASTAGPLVGTGTGENNRVSLTFTPTAGTLTATVSGTVTNAQLEVGSVPTSYIPTAASAVTRAADVHTAAAAKLPWPAIEYIGPELVTNGGFDTDTDWTKGTGWTIGGGQLVATSAASTSTTQSVTLVGGSVYQITGGNTAAIQVRIIGGTGQSLGYYSGTDIDRTFTFTAGAGTLLEIVANGTTTGVIDNISIRKITPPALTIQMEGYMTYADNSLSSELKFLEWYNDASNFITKELRTSGSWTGLYRLQQTALGVADTVSSGGDAYAAGINTPFNIVGTHGTTLLAGAVDGVALTDDTTPVALPDLSATDMLIASTGGPLFITQMRIWDEDITETNREGATA